MKNIDNKEKAYEDIQQLRAKIGKYGVTRWDKEWKEILNLYRSEIRKKEVKDVLYRTIIDVVEDNKGKNLTIDSIALNTIEKIRHNQIEGLDRLRGIYRAFYGCISNIQGSTYFDLFIPPLRTHVRNLFKWADIKGKSAAESFSERYGAGFHITEEVISKIKNYKSNKERKSQAKKSKREKMADKFEDFILGRMSPRERFEYEQDLPKFARVSLEVEEIDNFFNHIVGLKTVGFYPNGIINYEWGDIVLWKSNFLTIETYIYRDNSKDPVVHYRSYVDSKIRLKDENKIIELSKIVSEDPKEFADLYIGKTKPKAKSEKDKGMGESCSTQEDKERKEEKRKKRKMGR